MATGQSEHAARVGDAVEILNAPSAQTRLGMVKEVRDGVVTVLIGGGEGHCVVSVRPERLSYLGPSFWQITMRK